MTLGLPHVSSLLDLHDIDDDDDDEVYKEI